MQACRPSLLAAISLLLGGVLTGCPVAPPFPTFDEEIVLNGLYGLASQPPADPTNRWADSPQARDLGARLFDDPALSRCGTVSCASCHADASFASSEQRGLGCDGSQTDRNVISLLNAGYRDIFMWDGRADSLWSQAILEYVGPREMGGSPAHLRQRLSDPTYVTEYTELVGKTPGETPDGELLANFGKFLAAFQRTLIRHRAPIDDIVPRYLDAVRDGTQESDPAHLALKTYVRTGECAVCHLGASFEDGKFFNTGLTDLARGSRGAADGLPLLFESPYNAAGIYSDSRTGPQANRLQNLRAELRDLPETFLGAFRTSTLRDVELTAPYMHNGSLDTLEEVIEFYSRGGDPLGTFAGEPTETILVRDFTEDEKAALLEVMRWMTSEQ